MPNVRVADCGHLRGSEQWREGQPPRTKSAYSRRPTKKIRLPPGMKAGPVWPLTGGLPEQHQDPGGERHPVHRGHPRIGYGSPESGVAVSVARVGCRSGVRAGADPRADESRPGSLQAGFRERQGRQDCLQPVRAEPASPRSQESVRPGRGTPVATPRLVTSPDREVSGIRARDGRPDVAAVFQKLVVGIWNRGGGQGRLLPSGVIRSRSANTMRLPFSNLAVRIRLGPSRCFSELAVFDARLYIRVRRIDEPA
jgi:hypothetical protein